ncbi:MAG TPA: epoxyqueuosine reductase QueH [Candidatus Blautia gallistercoris]|uniref:Epoxyqueuosine reductase QueH n=1 Tax=Candidatus Blautia gallistercoris TaxID=2838490 RepID=A0A9D1WGH1_9FIRM|nr:epoxyqueuosine reductase QueH [Candidatus Blautia gallistercoris]
MKTAYQKELDRLIEKLKEKNEIPKLFLHSCCAPCSSYVLEYLSRYFSIHLFYYNPNISPEEEYHTRVEEQKRLIASLPTEHPVTFEEGPYEPERFYQAVKGLEKEKEGGRRCEVCFRLRLEETAKRAAASGFDFFTTTLSISPLKDAQKLGMIGKELEQDYQIRYLPSDFKKKNGYKRSVELSGEYGLYRQDYCGCIFSRREREDFLKSRQEPSKERID